jgi:hypothetical protein
MDGAPRFTDEERFDPRRVRLADVDGSGTTDLLYVGEDGVQVCFTAPATPGPSPTGSPSSPPPTPSRPCRWSTSWAPAGAPRLRPHHPVGHRGAARRYRLPGRRQLGPGVLDAPPAHRDLAPHRRIRRGRHRVAPLRPRILERAGPAAGGARRRPRGPCCCPIRCSPPGSTPASCARSYRALKGTVLRVEVYAEDGTERAAHPYTVTERRPCNSRCRGRSHLDAAQGDRHPEHPDAWRDRTRHPRRTSRPLCSAGLKAAPGAAALTSLHLPAARPRGRAAAFLLEDSSLMHRIRLAPRSGWSTPFRTRRTTGRSSTP